MGSENTVREKADEFFSVMRGSANSTVEQALKFVKEAGLEKHPHAQRMIMELDLHVREAMYRVNDLCALSVQTPAAAEERASGKAG